MTKKTQYVTQRMIEDFLIPYYRSTGNRLRFQDVIEKMQEQGLLSEEPLPVPELRWEQPTPEFRETFLHLPFDAAKILENADQSYTDLFREEQSAFPPGQDVFCRKAYPCLLDEPRSLSYFEIFFVYRGECRLHFAGDQIPLRQGDLCIVPPNAVHSLPLEPEDSVVSIVVRASTFDAQFGDLLTRAGTVAGFFRDSLYGRSAPNFLLLHTPSGDPRVEAHLRALMIESNIRDNHTNSCVTCGLKLFLTQSLRACRDEVEIYRAPSVGGPRADCGEILQYIHQNYRTVRLSTLAREFHYNETYLSRMLQNFAHKSFTEIVREIRMSRAEEYLRNSSLRVHEIAALVGYSSVDHFSRAFKTTHGKSPQAFRRQVGVSEPE